jgi:DNA-binding NtrC family response regulator
MGTVLVVEDEKALREGLKRLLSRQGYKVLTAENGQDALNIVGCNTEIDVMLCDLKMPVMGAIELLEKLGESRPDLPVVIVTGQGTPENILECRLKGAYELITKPFRIDDVLLTIECAIEKLPPPKKL